MIEIIISIVVVVSLVLVVNVVSSWNGYDAVNVDSLVSRPAVNVVSLVSVAVNVQSFIVDVIVVNVINIYLKMRVSNTRVTCVDDSSWVRGVIKEWDNTLVNVHYSYDRPHHIGYIKYDDNTVHKVSSTYLDTLQYGDRNEKGEIERCLSF